MGLNQTSYDVNIACTKIYQRHCGRPTLATSIRILQLQTPKECAKLPHDPVSVVTVTPPLEMTCSNPTALMNHVYNCLFSKRDGTNAVCSDSFSKDKAAVCLVGVTEQCFKTTHLSAEKLNKGIERLCENETDFNSTCVMNYLRDGRHCFDNTTMTTATPEGVCKYLSDGSNCLFGLAEVCEKSTSRILKIIQDHVTPAVCSPQILASPNRDTRPHTDSGACLQPVVFFTSLIMGLHVIS
ncbi:uncharacterized protein LOC121387197 [Gigantopelta aegis]|uniref:uncharacterized protein LOC121387197 n=1 Tax=Gigantopelta aegis TaxID=1735272 RepID=UPI001B88AD23|nr:uncharacterized protein LOC121387197 [Gigantopelta aegis]